MPIEDARAIRQNRLEAARAFLKPLLANHPRITLEIGCGHGHFLTAYAAAHPAEFCLGVDVLADRLERAERKSQRLKLKNLAWIHAEATLLLEALPADTRIGPHIFVLFPDPWPKRRHWKHRLLQPEFLSLLAGRSDPGATLCFRTDHAGYFAAATDILRSHPDWVPGDQPAEWPFELATVFQSRAPAYYSMTAHRR